MHILNAFHGSSEPFLPTGHNAVFEICQRGSGNQITVPIKNRQRNQHIAILGIQKLQCILQLFFFLLLLQIGIFYNTVVNCIRHLHHIVKVAV